MTNNTALTTPQSSSANEANNCAISNSKERPSISETAEHLMHLCKDEFTVRQLAQACASAQREYSDSERQELTKRLWFGEPWFNLLAAIGNDQRLEKLEEHLPDCLYTQFLISGLSDELFEAAKTEGLFTPSLNNNKLMLWKRAKCGNIDPNEPKLKATLFCLYSGTLLDDDSHDRMSEEIGFFVDSKGLRIVTFASGTPIALVTACFSKWAI